ncbi:MAG TPA: protein kinase [bacterium]|nr:protein kinase [bacterium]
MIATGKVIAQQYEILQRIGDGGMASVFTARRLADGQIIALKILREQYAADAEFVERFEREARAVSALAHPHMVRLIDSGRDGSVHFIAMEYIPGVNLKQLIRRHGPVPVADAVAIAAQVCEVLGYAHAHGVIHRDIKPQNILLTDDGGVKVTDFGIARATSAATITQTGTVLGSVQYLSPEQASGAEVGTAADIYGLGVVLYEMVTGRLPFDGDSAVAIAIKHIHEEPVPPQQLAPSVPDRVNGIILKALAKSPQGRYASAEEMREDLTGANDRWRLPAAAQIEDTPATMVLRPAGGAAPAVRRAMRVSPWLVALALLVVIAGGGWGGWRAFSSYLNVPEVIVPSLVGKPYSVAARLAAEARLRVELIEEAYSPTVPAGAVVSQDQPPGKQVKVGRVIGVVVSLGPEMIAVPDVQRRSLVEARVMIDQARLRIGELRETYNDEVKSGFIISQDPQPGARIIRGQPVNLLVSKGRRIIEMPQLIGRSLTEARRVLQELGMTLREVTTVPTSDLEPGIVVDQTPPPRTKITPQDAVSVRVSVRPGEEQTPPPSPVVTARPQAPSPEGEKVTRVQLVVPEGNAEQQVKIVVIDERGVRIAFERTLSPGSRVNETIRTRGYTIIQVFIDNRLVQEIRP